jgi:hypothetical protein
MGIFQIFDYGTAGLMASVVAFVAFFLIARVARARQGVALAFALVPLLLIYTIEVAVA